MNAYISKAAKFMPNNPVCNDEMEDYLGMIDGKPSKARTLILSRNGIKQRYYALDKNGNVTHSNAQMAANAIRGLLDEDFTLDDIDVLSCGTASPEQIMPSHGVMVHGELGGSRNIEVVSFAGSCCAGVDALKYACMAVQIDPSIKAVASASERLSAWMRASYFQKNYSLNSINGQCWLFKKIFCVGCCLMARMLCSFRVNPVRRSCHYGSTGLRSHPSPIGLKPVCMREVRKIQKAI